MVSTSVVGVCLAMALVVCVSFAHPEVVPLDNEGLGEAVLVGNAAPQDSSQNPGGKGGHSAQAEGGNGGKGGSPEAQAAAAKEAEESAQSGGKGGKGASEEAAAEKQAEQAAEGGKGGADPSAQSGGKGGKGASEEAAAEKQAEQAAEGGKGGPETQAEKKAEKEVEKQTVNSDTKAAATLNSAADPSSVGKTIQSDVSGAKTVAEVHNAVEQRVAAAMKAKTEQNELAKAEAATKAKIARLSNEENKAKTAKEQGKLESELVKEKLEKAKRKTMEEKAKREKAEQAASAAGKASQEEGQVEQAKALRMKKEEEAQTAALQRKVEEEKAKQAAAKRLTAEEELKAQEAKDNKAKAARLKMPKTEHEIRLAQAAAYQQAAALKTKEGNTLQLAANSKAKSDAYSLMTSTAAAVKELQGKLSSGNAEVSADASVAQKDLKKALDSPFSKNALEKVEKGRSEMKLATTDTADLKIQFESAQQSAAAAKEAYMKGISTNWGQNPAAAAAAPAAAEKTPDAAAAAAAAAAVETPAATVAPGDKKKEVFSTGDRSLSNDEEADKPKVSAVSKEQVEKDADEGKEPDYSKMTDQEVAYWLAKPMHYADSEPESTQKVEGNVFAVKEDEADQIRTLRSLAKTSVLDISADEQAAMQSGAPRVMNGTILDPKKDAAMLSAKPKIPELAPGETALDAQAKAPDDKQKNKPLTVLEVKMAQDENTENTESQMKQAKTAAGNIEQAIEQAKKPEDEKKPTGADQEVTQIEQAKAANPTPESEDKKPDAPAKKEESLTGSDNEVAQTKEAVKAAKTKPDTKPDMGESDSDFENEISADRVLEDSEIGDSAEGIDEANADSELDDVSVQNEDNEDDDDDDDDIDDEDE